MALAAPQKVPYLPHSLTPSLPPSLTPSLSSPSHPVTGPQSPIICQSSLPPFPVRSRTELRPTTPLAPQHAPPTSASQPPSPSLPTLAPLHPPNDLPPRAIPRRHQPHHRPQCTRRRSSRGLRMPDLPRVQREAPPEQAGATAGHEGGGEAAVSDRSCEPCWSPDPRLG